MSAPVVHTSAGAVRGTAGPHGPTFLGVPYADADRYRAPAPATSWEGTRDATAFAPPNPQPVRALAGIETSAFIGPPWEGTDAQLAANVWTPDTAGSAPVLVFIHGGAFVAGAPSAPIYDGAAFARDGIVCVTVNYRLGAEGFLPLDGGDTNVAVRDQLAALRWVRDEIAAFGGDPANVTVCGQSAGAICLALLLSGGQAQGLLRRAIVQSGGAALTFSVDQGRRVAAALADALGVEPTREAFAGVPVARVMEAQAALGPVDLTSGGERDRTGGLVPMLPVRDGDVIAADPVAAIAAGAAGDVPLLVGDCTEEGNLYLAATPQFDAFPEEHARGLAAMHHPDPDALFAAYRRERPGITGGQLAAQTMTDTAFRLPTQRLADAQASAGAPTHVYEFAWRSAAAGGRLGAAHAMELPFVFDTTDAPGLRGETGLLGPGEPPAALADELHATWVAFARDGDPGWPAYDTSRRTVRRFAAPSQTLEDPRPGLREAWEGVD